MFADSFCARTGRSSTGKFESQHRSTNPRPTLSLRASALAAACGAASRRRKPQLGARFLAALTYYDEYPSQSALLREPGIKFVTIGMNTVNFRVS